MLPNLSGLLISFSLFSRSSCRLHIALCGRSDNWESYPDAWLPNDRSRTSTLPTQWCLHAAAFYDRGEQSMLCPVALTCSHCDIVNQTLQFRRIGCRSAVALSSPMWQITADVPVSDVRHRYRSETSLKGLAIWVCVWQELRLIDTDWRRDLLTHLLTPVPYSQKCLTYMMLQENPSFHAVAIQSAEGVPRGVGQ